MRQRRVGAPRVLQALLALPSCSHHAFHRADGHCGMPCGPGRPRERLSPPLTVRQGHAPSLVEEGNRRTMVAFMAARRSPRCENLHALTPLRVEELRTVPLGSTALMNLQHDVRSAQHAACSTHHGTARQTQYGEEPAPPWPYIYIYIYGPTTSGQVVA